MTDHRTAARIEDAAFMAATGEDLDGAARRLQMTPGSLQRLLQRHGRRDLCEALGVAPAAQHHGRGVLRDRIRQT